MLPLKSGRVIEKDVYFSVLNALARANGECELVFKSCYKKARNDAYHIMDNEGVYALEAMKKHNILASNEQIPLFIKDIILSCIEKENGKYTMKV